ncbi:MAG: hypothetical protein GX493_03795 [Firmicutes bacterium]|nr:hypothetical protein [Bacillota bacterium]
MGLVIDAGGIGWEATYGHPDWKLGLQLRRRWEGGLGAGLEIRGRF